MAPSSVAATMLTGNVPPAITESSNGSVPVHARVGIEDVHRRRAGAARHEQVAGRGVMGQTTRQVGGVEERDSTRREAHSGVSW